MIELAERAVTQALAAGAEYADARIVRLAREDLCLRNGALADAAAPAEFGLGVRALVNGTFGFAAAPGAPRDLADLAPGVARRAVRSARDLAPTRRRPVELAPEPPHVAEWATPVAEDGFALSLEDKLELLHAADAGLGGESEIVVREVRLSLRREEQWTATSSGAAVHQVLVRSGGGIAAVAAAGHEVERRSYPSSLGGNHRGGGFEVLREMDLPGHAERVRDEAIALCFADPCEAGERTLILGSAQLMLQIHESVGHPTELDRVMHEELDLAGGSFAAADGLGSLRYGSPIVDLVADGTLPGGLATRGFDDEAVPARSFDVVRGGRLVGFHTTRDWAHAIGEGASRGNARAEGWYAPPILRMTNLSLRPGRGSLAELLADTEDGAVLADTVKTWSIDSERLEFQFTCEIGYEVAGGRLGRILRSPTYQGSTPAFWASCDAICGPAEWQVFGVPNCGKGNPLQVAEMSHGASPARFRRVRFVQ